MTSSILNRRGFSWIYVLIMLSGADTVPRN